MADFYTLRKRLEEDRRKELAQQTAPVSFATGERIENQGQGDPLTELRAKIAENMATKMPISSIRNQKIPYTVDKTDYEGYSDLVKAYTDALRGKTKNILPSTARNISGYIANEGREVGRIGTGAMMFAGGNKLDQTPIKQARSDQLGAELEAGRAITAANKYGTDLDYLLGEKTGSLSEFGARMDEARKNPEDVKKVVSWGQGKTTKGMTAKAHAAAETAEDWQLEGLLKSAKNRGEIEAFQAEIERRKTPAGRDKTGIGQYGRGNIDLYNRKPYIHEDGSISTVYSISVGIDGKNVLLPTIIDGKLVSDEEAIEHYQETGENLGVFDDPEEMDEYAQLLHEQQEMIYTDSPASARDMLIGLMNDDERRMIEMSAAWGWEPTDDDIVAQLEGEAELIASDLKNPSLAEHERKELEARQKELQDGLKIYYGENDSPEVQAYREAQAEGLDLPFTEQYTRQQQKAAEDWTAATRGEYKGTDPELQRYNQEYPAMFEELYQLQYMTASGMDFSGNVLTSAQIAEKNQQMHELEAKMQAMEAEAREHISSANDAVTAVQEAKYGKKDFGRFLGEAVKSGFTGFADKFYQAIDFVFGKPVNTVGQFFDRNFQNPYSRAAGYYSRNINNPAQTEAQMASSAMGGGGWNIGREAISSMVENIPNTLMAILSGGTSAAAGVAGQQTAAIGAMADVGKNAATKVVENLLGDYNYWTSFMQEIGGEYDEAVETMKEQNNGEVNELAATVYAMVTTFINAGIEIGTDGASGIQGISKDTDTGIVGRVVQAVAGHDMPLLESIIDSARDEATEELKQGIVGGLAMKALVDHDLQWITTDGSKAVFNAQETGQSMLVGGLTGGLLAGVSEPLGRSSQQRAQNLEIGSRIVENQWNQQLGQVASDAGIQNKILEGLREGTLDVSKKNNLRKVGQVYTEVAELDNEAGKKAREAASAMLSHNRGKIATDTQKEAIETGKRLAGTLQVSEDGKLRVIRGEKNGEKAEVEVSTGKTVPATAKTESETEKTEPAAETRESTEGKTETAAEAPETTEEKTETEEKAPESEAKETETEAEAPEATGEKTDQPAEEQESAPEAEMVGVTVKDDKPFVKIRQNGKIEEVAFEDVQFPDEATAEKAAISAMVGNEELSNAMFNAKAPGGDISFAEYARQFANAYEAAKNGLLEGAIKAAGIVDGLQDVELHAAFTLGEARQYIDDTMDEMRRQARSYIAGKLRGKVEDGDAYAVSDALLKQEAGEDLTEQEETLLDKYKDNDQVQDALQEMQEDDVFNADLEEEPAIGTNTAYQYGLSGRRLEELESTLQDQGAELTDEIRAEYERGAADLAYKETKRIEQVNALNRGKDGTRVGVLRSISAQEAADFGVGQISGEYTGKVRSAITALRGLADATGVNIVLFESPVKEGMHQGANGWYDRNTQTVYLDVFSGKDNEQALIRTAAHELTHFIQDWSPAMYKKYREFLLDYYYGTDKNTVKTLIQEQLDKDSTLTTEAEAMDEVIADASEMMISGDEDATRALAEKHPSLFVRVRGWIDTWAKAVHRAWHAISGTSNEASRLLKNTAETFSEAQRMWWSMLEDASMNLRGKIREAEIDAEQMARLQRLRETKARWKEEYEKRKQAAIERANAAETAAEAQQAVADVQAAEAAEKAMETQQKKEAAEINREAEEKKKDAAGITRKGKQIERKLNKLSEDAQAYVRQWAEEHGIALDGTMQTGSALSKMAAHYYNQGKAGIAFTPNTDDITDENREFARHMNELGMTLYEETALQAVAEETAQAGTTEQEQAAAEQETAEQPAAEEKTETETETAEQPAAVEETETETAEQPAAEEKTETEMEAALQALAGEETETEAEAEKETEAEAEQQETADNEETEAEAEPAAETGEETTASAGSRFYPGERTGLPYDLVIETIPATPEEKKAAKQHAETVEKMEDVLKGMPKKARGLVMKWAANEWVNVNLEDGSPAAISFAKFAAKWYNAGREGTSKIHVPWVDADADYPVFLQDTFYNQGRADAEAAEKRKKAREGKKNEKPADKGTGEGTGLSGLGAERVLAEVPAEDVQGESGGRDAVSEPEGAERLDGGNDAGSDEPGTVRERGEGVRERDHVRPAAGEVTEEAEPTPEEQLAETVQETEEQLEAETPRGTNYSIGESLDLPKGEKARFKANVEAIRLLKKLEAENRYATKEEQEILSKYVGWGGLDQAFEKKNSKWTKEYAELAELMTEDEYSAARASTMNAHYTSIDVIRAMYDGLRHLGFQGGRMLEPSGGIGHFIGAMPADLQQKVRGWTMVELDSITGRIAEKLYPNADVRVEGFEKAKIGDNIMDVAIGNVPFGNFKVVDDKYPSEVKGSLHNYFFAKAIDKVRPGGLLMFITSHYTMDANNTSVRDYMMKRADLLGAVRLPNTAFKGNAGTPVTTDILVFKKREPGTPYRGQSMLRAEYVELPGGYGFVNQYFAEHPDMVLGETSMTGTMYRGGELTVNPRPGNLGDQIREAMGKIEGTMDYTNTPTVEVLRERAEKARKNTKENGFEVKDGKLYQNKNGELQAVEMKEADAQKVRGMLSIRDTARELQEMQKRGASEEEIRETRKKLNLQYDEFVKHNGLLHDRKNTKLIENDPDHFFIMALEDYDKKTKTATKAAIFDRNTIAREVTVTHADTPQDALAVVLNEKGYIDLARAAELLGMSTEDTQAAMINTGLAFLKPDGTLDTRENYLSGNVRAKMREAEALATVDDRYQRNVDELKKVIPEDIGRESIYVKPGATWIPDAIYEQFICETLRTWNGYRKNVTVKYVPSSGDYTLELSTQAKRDYRNTQEWGTPDKTFAEILEALMNNKQISVYRRFDDKSVLDEAATLAAREKAEKIQKHFQEWLWQNEERAKQLETLYNDKYNAIVTPDYDGSSLTIAGANADKQLRPHQKNVVHRIVQGGGNTLIAHCVGAGKTAEMAGAAMKLRQLGIVQKPVFVVPKALVGQWGKEFLDFFPAAKILVLSENDFNAKNRKEFANRIATGDYDAVIMSREQYSHIPMTPEYEQKFYADTIAQITAAIDDEKRASGKQGLSVKNMEKTKKRLEAKLKKLETKARDADNIYFEDMGIDSIFVDEAHEYKNLMFTTNMNNVSGLGNKEGSQRAFDMYMKTRYLRKLNGGRGIVFATATPVMNSMSEMYIMQKYLQEDTLNQLGIQSFDAWANLFGEVMTVIEPTPSGKGFRQKQAFARFKNLPELQRLFRSFADVKTKVEGLKIPKMKTGKRITIECEPGQFQLDYIDKLAERAEKMKSGHVDPKVDNMLKITSEGRKLSYTQRMIDPSLPYEDGSKIVRCVEEVEKIWKESKKNKGTQLIFCDMATPKGSSNVEADSQTDTAEDTENVDFYGDIKRMLVAKGIPANEIAFIHDADTNEKKNKLFEDVNNGTVRVLIGSTGKMGVGMNAQKRIVALHHLDAPWRPGDIEQREGRALRQGNINEEVGIYVYVTKKTFDTRMWDNLYRKSSFINQIMNGTNTAREVEGDGDFALSAAEIKAIATGDPMIVEQFEVANKIKQLENLEREHNREKKLARYDMQANEAHIAAYRQSLPLVEKDQKTAAEILEKDFRMKVEGKIYDARAKAAGPLLDAIKKRQGFPGEEKIAEFGSFSIMVNGRGEITIKGAGQYAVNANLESADGNITRILNKIKNLQENLDNMRAGIRQLEEANQSLQAKLNAPFERAAELEQLRARAEEIANILNPVEDQAGAAAVDGSEETETQQPEEKSGRVKSERDPNALSNRQILARAYEGVAKTDYERKSLERYKGIIAQLDSDTEKLRDLRRQIHDKKFVKGQVDRPGALKLEEQANELEKKIAKADKTLLYMERSASLKNVLEVEKREAEKKLREKIKGQMKRYNEGVEKREYEQRIKKTTERLAKWIVQPDKTNHVPKALRSSVAKFLLSIQQGQRTEFRGKGGERRESNFLQNMRELQGIVSDINAYQMMGADERVKEDFGMYIDLPDGFADQMADMIRRVEDTMKKAGAGSGFAVDYMNAEQLKTLNQVLNTISSSITQANNMLAINSFQHVSQAAQNSIAFIRSQGRVENMTGGQVHNFLNWENMQPIRAFARFGEGGEAVFKSLMRGQAQMARNVREVIDMTEKVYTAEEARTWSEEIKTYDVGGKKISMPVADVMSMYCLMKRAQAVGHILGEGFRVADFKQGRKTVTGSGVTVTAEEAATIIDSLTPRQRAVADELQRIMSTTGSRWGNYVSMKRFGYEMFTEQNYFPIEVDSDRLMAKTDESKGNELYRLLNLSSVKPITRGANNRLMLKNIFEVYASHMSDMAQYNAMGLPVLDAVKWINYRESMEKDDGSIETEGVRSAAREMYGNKSQRYIIELLKDINGTQATGDMGEQWSRKMLMRFNRQAVAANLSVAAKQPTSIIRAAMELGGFDLIRGAMGSQGKFKQNRAEMLEYSGIAVWKDLGFYDVNVSRPVKQMIMHADTLADRIMEKTTWLPEKADEITWAAMWGACKEWVRRQGKTYASTEAFMQAVADKFEDVIYKTQVVDSILTRSQFMRGTSFMNKMLSSFMSEPTTTYNMLLEAWHQFRNDMRRGDNMGQAFMKNRSIITRTTAVYFVSATVMTILNALIGAMRDDDDYETFMEKFQNGLLDNAVDEVLPFNLLPIVSDVYDYAKKFLGEYVLPDEWGISSYAGGSSAIYSAMDTALSAVEIAEKYFSGESRYTWYAVTYKTANALSQAAGVPVAPAMRDVVSIWNTFIAPFAPEMRIETYESTEAQGAKALYGAITAGNKDREAMVRRQLAANNANEKKLDSALRSLIKEDKESGKVTDEQAARYLQDIAGLKANDAYFKVQEWGYEAENDDQYSKYTRLEEAVKKNSGVQAAVTELTQHGMTEKQVQTKIRSIISDQAIQNNMQPATVENLLKKYGGMNENEAWIRSQELNYQKLTGTKTTSDIAMISYAVEKHTSPKAAIDGLLAHGKEKKNIASSITSKYKEEYLSLRKTNASKAATLKGQLISMFEYLGYDGKKKVEEWENPKKKKR